MPEKRTKTARKGTKPATLPELQAWLLNSGLLRTRRLNMALIGREMTADKLGKWTGKKVKRLLDKLYPAYL